MSQYFDETVRLQSEKREKSIREIRGERLQGIAEGASSAPRLASSSAASFPRRNECPGTHCSLIDRRKKKTVPARSATEFEMRGQGDEDRTRVSQEKKREITDLLVLPRPAKSVQNGAGFSGKT